MGPQPGPEFEPIFGICWQKMWARIPKAQETVHFLGLVLEPQDLEADQEIPSNVTSSSAKCSCIAPRYCLSWIHIIFPKTVTLMCFSPITTPVGKARLLKRMFHRLLRAAITFPTRLSAPSCPFLHVSVNFLHNSFPLLSSLSLKTLAVVCYKIPVCTQGGFGKRLSIAKLQLKQTINKQCFQLYAVSDRYPLNISLLFCGCDLEL